MIKKERITKLKEMYTQEIVAQLQRIDMSKIRDRVLSDLKECHETALYEAIGIKKDRWDGKYTVEQRSPLYGKFSLAATQLVDTLEFPIPELTTAQHNQIQKYFNAEYFKACKEFAQRRSRALAEQDVEVLLTSLGLDGEE